ncbi:uncharacterized protein LOC120839290 [Ixodes scapularis]|uniref:uncharacterized protein LOC120839290 n=1 Tax=Ixodes scapularis TaxID=6945 RepID=UPI001A9EB05B|nr:uncharacterized protein LOC120839290 [Ixodes scapularis]
MREQHLVTCLQPCRRERITIKSLQRRNSYFLRDALFKADFATPDSPATLRFLDLRFAAGFLLAPTFLFFAGDDRPVADLLRLDLRLLLFPDVAFLALDLLVVALALLALERDDGRRLVRLLVLRFAGVAEDDLERLLEAAALFLLRPRTREGDAMEAPSPTTLVDAGAMRKDLVRLAWTFSLPRRSWHRTSSYLRTGCCLLSCRNPEGRRRRTPKRNADALWMSARRAKGVVASSWGLLAGS